MRAVTDFEDEDSMMQETNMLSIEESQVDLLESDILMVNAHQSEVSDLSYPNKLFIHLVLQEKTIRFQVDTGASCDILRVEELRDRTMLQPTRQRLRLYDGTVVAPVGQIRLEVTNPKTKQRYNCEFIVVSGAAVSLVGAKTSLAMGLLKIEYQNIANTDAIESEQVVSTREDVVTRYHDVFSEEVGHLEGDLHLELDPQVTPVQLPVRKIPLALQEHLQVELQELEERGSIARVDVPTDWVSGMVVERNKNGKLRVCLDPRPLNKALKKAHYLMPAVDDILPALANARVFRVCDLPNGFWHISLDEESSYLTTFATLLGRYC